MEFKLRKPIGYSHIGRKDQQEDAVWPLFEDVTTDNRCIVLCDGVGGSEHGELASQNSSRIIGEHLSNIIATEGVVDETDVQTAVEKAYVLLESIDKDRSEDRCTMATTLTCVCLHGNGVLAAHMGDSRIYHVRPNVGVLYRSADHSLVQALLQAGELTPEEAKTFPRKNVITKAIQPHSAHLSAEIQNITDVKSGDYLFLCCDGVLENLTDERLAEVLSMACSDAEKLKLIEAESIDKTRDNYTAYLIPIEKVEGNVTEDYVDQTEYVEITHVESKLSPEITKSSPLLVNNQSLRLLAKEEEGKKRVFGQYLIATLIVMIFLLIVIMNIIS